MDRTGIQRQDPRAVAWLVALIDEYRRQARAVEPPVLRLVPASHRLGRPTQIAHIWIKAQPPMDVHFVLVMHLPQLPDKAVYSWGPIEPKSLAAVFEELDAQAWYHAPMKQVRRGPLEYVWAATEHGLLRDRVDQELVNLRHWLQFVLFNPQREDRNLWLQGSHMNIGAAKFHGDLLGREPSQLVAQFFKDAEGNRRSRREYLKERRSRPPAPAPEPRKEKPTGYTCVLYPARHIGKNPARSISDRLWGPYKDGPGIVVLDRRVGGRRVFATYEGVVGVVEPDKARARHYLNLVCLALREEGRPSAFLRPRDLGVFTWRDGQADKPEFSSWSFAPEDRPTADKADWTAFQQWVSLSRMEKAFCRAAELEASRDAESLVALLEAETHFEDEEYRQAFFLSWIVVEKRLIDAWERLLTFMVGAPTKQSKDAEWKPVLIADAFERVNALSEPVAARLRAFNTKRNRILHGQEAVRADAKQMLELARETLTELRQAESRLLKGNSAGARP